MLTVKQLANKLEVSKPTITRNKPENMSFEIINNTYYINEELEQYITENVLKNKARYSDNTETETGTDKLTQQLLQENAFLRTQISEKDNLIKEQTRLLDQQQRLNLITSNRLDELNKQPEQESETYSKQDETFSEKNSETEKSFLKKLFKR